MCLEVKEVINKRLRTGTDENNDNDCNVDFSSNKQLMAKKRLKIHNKSSEKKDGKRSDLSSDQIVFGCDVCHKFKFNLRSRADLIKMGFSSDWRPITGERLSGAERC